MARNAISTKVPVEFDDFIDDLSEEFSKQTGLRKSKTATMRRMAIALKGKIITKGTNFQWNGW